MTTDTKFDEGFEEVPFDEGFEEVKLDDGFEEVPMETPEVSLREKAIMAQPSMPTAQELTKNDMVSTIEPLKEGQMGPLEAAAINAAPSMTLGVSDVIAGAAGAAGHAYGSVMEGQGVPSGSELLDTYYEAKKGEGKRREKGMEDQPAASIAGMVGGGALLTTVAGPVAGVLAKYGKAGKLAANVLPSMKGFSEGARAAKLAKNAKDMRHLYNTYKTLRKGAILKTGLAGITEGAKAGAIMGATMGEAELMNGELAKTAKDIVEGGVSGAVVGGVLSGGTLLAGTALEAFPGVKSIVDSFKAGRAGHELKTDYIQNNTKKLVKGFLKDMNGKFKSLGADRKSLLKNAKALNTMVKTEDDVAAAVGFMNELDSSSFKAKSEDYVSMLREHLGKSKDMRKIEEALIKKQAQMNQMDLGLDEVASRKLAKDQINQVLKKGKAPTKVTEGDIKAKDFINTDKDIKLKVQERDFGTGKPTIKTAEVTPTAGKIRTGIDPETGLEFGAIKNAATGKETIKVAGKPVVQLVDGKSTLDEAINFKKQIQDYTFLNAGQDVPSEVKKNATMLVKQLQNKIDKAVAEGNPEVNLSEFNKKFSKLYNTFETIGVKAKPVGDVQKFEQLKNMASFITDSGDNKTFRNLDMFLEQLNSGAPEIAKKYGAEIAQMRKLVDLSAGTEYVPLGANKLLTTFMGTIGGAVNRAANLAGRVSKGTSRSLNIKNTLAAQTRRATEASPEMVRNMISKIDAGANKSYQAFKPVLEKIAEADGRKRAAIMFGLMQDPTFRELMKDEEDNE